jgi:hypothetical protein
MEGMFDSMHSRHVRRAGGGLDSRWRNILQQDARQAGTRDKKPPPRYRMQGL